MLIVNRTNPAYLIFHKLARRTAIERAKRTLGVERVHIVGEYLRETARGHLTIVFEFYGPNRLVSFAFRLPDSLTTNPADARA